MKRVIFYQKYNQKKYGNNIRLGRRSSPHYVTVLVCVCMTLCVFVIPISIYALQSNIVEGMFDNNCIFNIRDWTTWKK